MQKSFRKKLKLNAVNINSINYIILITVITTQDKTCISLVISWRYYVTLEQILIY